MPPFLVTILYAALNCWRLATLGGLREQHRPTLSRTDREPRIISMPQEKPFPENFTLGVRDQTPLRSAGWTESPLE